MIKDIVQGAVKAAGGWVGGLIGGEPGRIAGSKLAGSLSFSNLFEKFLNVKLFINFFSFKTNSLVSLILLLKFLFL